MIKIRVLYLGSMRERQQKDSEEMSVEDRMTVYMLRRRLFHKIPKATLAQLLESVDFTVNLGKAALNTVLKNGDEVAVIPKNMKVKTALKM